MVDERIGRLDNSMAASLQRPTQWMPEIAIFRLLAHRVSYQRSRWNSYSQLCDSVQSKTHRRRWSDTRSSKCFYEAQPPALFELRWQATSSSQIAKRRDLLRRLSNNQELSPAFWPETTAGGTYPVRTGSSPHLCFARELCGRDAISDRHGCTPACTLTLSVLRSVQPIPVEPISLKNHLFIP